MKTAAAFQDSDRPDLVFLVPKRHVSRQGFIIVPMEDELWISVYLERGAPTLVLDIDTSDILNLAPRRSSSETADTITNRFSIEEIRMLQKGRRADLLLVSEAW